MAGRYAIVLLLFCALLPGGQNANPGELERTEQLIQQLSALKAKVAAMEQELDAALKLLAEHKGSIQAGPPAYNALQNIAADTPADTRKATSRCAALTGKGARCSRPAIEGSRYCKQHQLANQR